MHTWKRGALWGVATIALLAVSASGKPLSGQSDAASRPATPVANDSWPEVNLNVVVLDKQGVPQKVNEREFQLFEDDAERPLHFLGSADSPVSLALIIDTSGSMYNRQGSITAAVHAILNGLPNGSEVMAVLFADEAFLDLPFTPASGIDYSFLDRLNARGGTTLYDTVVEAEKYFAAHARYVRRAIVLISDGGDNSSHSPRADAIRSLQWPGAPTLYSLHLPDTEVSGVGTRHGKLAMELFAKAGGGVSFTPKEKDFAPAIARLADMIRSQYVLHFTTADPARDGRAHKLEVRLPIKDVEVHALPVYCAPAK
jgi:Ca-activated chloride channel family protein